MIKETTITGYRCSCGLIFDSKEEYVKAILHRDKYNHTLESVNSTQKVEELTFENVKVEEKTSSNDISMSHFEDKDKYGILDI